MINYPLNIRRSEWENLDDKEQVELRQDIIKYFRVNGFPHFKYSLQEQVEELDRLDRYMEKSQLEEDGIIKQTMHGMGLCWSYHPHHWDIRCGKSKTPMEVFLDDNLLDKAIKKRMKTGTHINEAMMRKTFKVSGGAQTVSNFRPTVARWIYDKYGGEHVYDPCAGFGGRMIGAITSPRVKYYEGCEPSTLTKKGLDEMAFKLCCDTSIIIRQKCAEDHIPENSPDLIFTSPPYFDTEKYSNEDTQSYLKYPTYEEWRLGFLVPLVSNSVYALKQEGYFIINIANVKNAKTLEDDFQKLAKDYNLQHVTTYKMTLSKQHSGGKFKYEPIFVYRKV